MSGCADESSFHTPAKHAPGSPDSAFRALNISTTTSTLMDTVEGLRDLNTSQAVPSQCWKSRSAAQDSWGPPCMIVEWDESVDARGTEQDPP